MEATKFSLIPQSSPSDPGNSSRKGNANPIEIVGWSNIPPIAIKGIGASASGIVLVVIGTRYGVFSLLHLFWPSSEIDGLDALFTIVKPQPLLYPFQINAIGQEQTGT